MIFYWHWLLLGFAFTTVELFLPGAFCLWVGIGAFILAGIAYLFPWLSDLVQLILFGALAPVITLIGRKLMAAHQDKGGIPSLLNRRGAQLVGQVIILDAPLLNGHAHITVGDSKWRVKGPELPAGAEVTIIGVEGNMLLVDSIKK